MFIGFAERLKHIEFYKQVNDMKYYVDGKPDYADVFEDTMIFRCDSQIGRGIDSSYMEDTAILQGLK